MNNIFNYLCCLGRSEKNINWQAATDEQQLRQFNSEVNISTTGCSQQRGGEWDEEKDRELLRVCQQEGGDLKAIQQGLSQRRTKVEIQQRLKKLSSNKQRHMWSQEEDQILLELYREYGPNWQNIAFYLKERTGKQVRDRYINILDPDINKGPWTHQEDQLILRQYQLLGPKWSKISVDLKGRPENMVKNRWYSYIKKRLDRIDKDDRHIHQEQEDRHIHQEQDDRHIHQEQEDKAILKEVKKEETLDAEDMSEHGGDFQFNQQMEIEQEIQNQNILSKNNLLHSSGHLQPHFDSNNTQYCSLYPKNYEYQQPQQQQSNMFAFN